MRLLCRLIADAVTEGRFIRANRPTIVKNASAVTPVPETTPFVAPAPVVECARRERPSSSSARPSEPAVAEPEAHAEPEVAPTPVVESAPVASAPVVEAAPEAHVEPEVAPTPVVESAPIEETVDQTDGKQ